MSTFSPSNVALADSEEVVTRRSPVHVALTVGLALFLLIGAVGKALAPDGVVRIVLFLLEPIGAGATSALLLTSGLILFEGLLAWALLCGVRLRLTLLATFATLIMFTFILAYLAVQPHTPPCGCGGAFSFATLISESPAFSVFRNLALIWLVCGLWLAAPSRIPG